MTDVYNCPSCGEESICTPECEGLRVAFRDITHRVEVAEQELRETAGELEVERARVVKLEAEREQDLSQLQRGTVAMERSIQTIDALRARVKEATTLLASAANVVEWQGWHDDYQAFLASCAPAQPAAPTPDFPSTIRKAKECQAQLADALDKLDGAVRSAEHWEARATSLDAVLVAAREVADLHDQGEVAPSLLEALANAVSAADGDDDEPAAPEPSADRIRRLDMQPGILLSRAESAEAQLAAVNERIRKALVYLTDKDDIESTPLHAIGHAVALLTPAPSPGAGEKRCGVTAWNRWELPCDREPGHSGTHSHDPRPGPGAGGGK